MVGYDEAVDLVLRARGGYELVFTVKLDMLDAAKKAWQPDGYWVCWSKRASGLSLWASGEGWSRRDTNTRLSVVRLNRI